MKKKTIIIILIIIAAAVFSGFYLHYENTQLEVIHYIVTDDNLPIDFDNYKIVHISDFHNTKSETLKNDLIKEIENQTPDMIVITGDLIDSYKTDIDIAVDFIKNINDIAPVYFVSGNHEANTSTYSKLKDQLKENKVAILENKAEVIKINDSEINLIGVDDPQMANENAVSDSEIIKAELDNANYNKNKYSILLSHRPELFDTYTEKEINLILSGHTHGGQIRIPFVGAVGAPNQGLFPKYTAGMFEENKTKMIISCGIGNSILPFRINNRPELVVITLDSE